RANTRYTATDWPKVATSSFRWDRGGSPDTLALVAAIGPALRSKDEVSARSGTRRAIDSRRSPSSQGRERLDRGSTIVRGPGQNASAKRAARSSGTPNSQARSAAAASTGRLRPWGRRFAANTRSVADGSSGRHAIPYTVSVGRTRSEPCASARAAAARTSEAIFVCAGSTSKTSLTAHELGRGPPDLAPPSPATPRPGRGGPRTTPAPGPPGRRRSRPRATRPGPAMPAPARPAARGLASPPPGPRTAPFPSSSSWPDACLDPRSEEHTSELQSRGHLVCRLLLEKKKKKKKNKL